jgi:hypothetical protein
VAAFESPNQRVGDFSAGNCAVVLGHDVSVTIDYFGQRKTSRADIARQ